MMQRIILLLLVGLSLSGCSRSITSHLGKDAKAKDKGPNFAYSGIAAEDIPKVYAQAQQYLRVYKYDEAVEDYEKLIGVDHFSQDAQKYYAEKGYAYFKAGDTELASATGTVLLNRFKGSRDYSDYAYYLQAMAIISDNGSLLQRWFKQGRYLRSVADLVGAELIFGQIVANNNDSVYRQEAQHWQCLVRSMIDKHELGIAGFYYNDNAYIAAANRAWLVAQKTSDSSVYNSAITIVNNSISSLKLAAADWNQKALTQTRELSECDSGGLSFYNYSILPPPSYHELAEGND